MRKILNYKTRKENLENIFMNVLFLDVYHNIFFSELCWLC